ncbi:hypothetical protein ACYST8_23820 [Pseudomonas inefficax]
MVDFFENGLCLHCHLAKNEVIELLAFNDKAEDAWRLRNANLQEELEVIFSKYPVEKHEDIVDSYAWDLHLNQYKYPALHRESLLITIFSFLEHQLNSLCEILQQSVGGSLKLGDLYGSGVERALLYLSKVAEVDLSSFGAELPRIKGVNLVRNILVHNGGVLPSDSNAKVNKFIEQSAGISAGGGGRVFIGSEFIPGFIRTLIDFFERLDGEMQEHIRNHPAVA